MGATDKYLRLKSPEKEALFTELFDLKEQKAVLDKRIKEIEKEYKGDIAGLERDLFYELDNGTKFSIKFSTRKGSIDTEAIKEATGIDCNDYRKKDTIINTLRKDK